jgi:hypothetical protein
VAKRIRFSLTDDEKKTGKNYLVSAAFSVVIIALVKSIWPNLIPFGAFEFWQPKGGLLAWLAAGWPLLAWGVGLTAVLSILTKNKPEVNRNAERHMLAGLVISVWAGVVEEICFRWLIFLASIVTVRVGNIIFCGLVRLIHLYVTGQVANFVTIGFLRPYLFHPASWAVGAGLLAANAFFRDGHKYQGWFGFINSWFCGMFLFWIMFRHGLLAGILIHFLYDLLVFGVRYVDMVIERAQGRA